MLPALALTVALVLFLALARLRRVGHWPTRAARLPDSPGASAAAGLLYSHDHAHNRDAELTAPAHGHDARGGGGLAKRRTRIVVLGGGFAGVYAAQGLERHFGRRDDVEVVLVSKENYFVFQPMLPEVISGSIGVLDLVTPLRRMLPRTDIHTREVEAVDLAARTVTTSSGFRPHPHALEYDHLVIALGTVTDFRGLRGLPEHAMPFKNLADALHLRNHVIRALEEAAIEHHDAELRRQLLTFVVAGGGFSGVEVVAELNDFVRGVARHYRGIRPEELRVVLLHSQGRILPEMSESLGLFAQRLLGARGVEVMLNVRLSAATGEEAVLADGTRIPTRTIVSTVPASPHPLIDTLVLAKNKAGRLEVDEFLRVKGTDNVWALGDCAVVPVVGLDQPAPPTAQHAIRQGQLVADNIAAALRGAAPRAFDFKGLGKLGSLGHRSAVADVFGLKVSGFLAWFLWRSIYLMKMPGWGRRIKIATSWTLDLFLPPELVQLRLAGSSGVAQEHYEPGQAVFMQGDLGDRVYIVMRGAAEVVRREGDAELCLARLGPGECFGEMALLAMTARNATVRCLEPMDVLSLSKREFTVLAANLPALRKSFEQVAERRMERVRHSTLPGGDAAAADGGMSGHMPS